MSNYPKEVAERMIINLARQEDLTEAFDAIFDHPELRAELEADDLTASEMLDRIRDRN